jgi:enterochelin esterase-like enzyme
VTLGNTYSRELLRRDAAAFNASAKLDEPYALGADSLPQPGVPTGVISDHHWQSEHSYPGTERDYWLYVPQQYNESQPACLMVFQDGESYLKEGIPTVFDNLIHRGEIPVTVGLFVNPGTPGPGNPVYGGTDNRSVEYDSLGDAYARFLLEELIPEVTRIYRVTDDRAGRAICGISSGGICAFTAAWERPDSFGCVVSHCGSFTNIRGGHTYPSLIRLNDRKPIRVFLQGGSNDVDCVYGSWSLANLEMAAAFAYRDYDYQFVYGVGGHSLKHGASIFPETLRWLWRDYPR